MPKVILARVPLAGVPVMGRPSTALYNPNEENQFRADVERAFLKIPGAAADGGALYLPLTGGVLAGSTANDTLEIIKRAGFNYAAVRITDAGATPYTSNGGAQRLNFFGGLSGGAIANMGLNFLIDSSGNSGRDDTSKSAWGFTFDNRTGIDQFRLNYYAGTDYFPIQIFADTTAKFAKATATGGNSGASQVQIIPKSSSTRGLDITAASSQTADLQRFIASDGTTVLSQVTAAGVFTGSVAAHTETAAHTALGSASGTVTLDLSLSNSFSVTSTGNITLAVSNAPSSGVVAGIMLEITNGGAHTMTYPASFKFPAATPPTLTASGKDVIGFTTRDGGATWLYSGIQKDVR